MLRQAAIADVIGGSSNAASVLEKLKAQAERLSNLSVPLTQAGVIVRDAAVMRIKEQGGDQQWPATRRGGHMGIITGRMMASIQPSPVENNTIKIGTNLIYAKYFQMGTGIFAGHSPWTVKPKSKKALAFTINGVSYIRRSVTIPGEPKRPFLVVAIAQKEDIAKSFARWIWEGAA